MHESICFKRIKRIVKNIWIVECGRQVKGLTHFLHSVRKFPAIQMQAEQKMQQKKKTEEADRAKLHEVTIWTEIQPLNSRKSRENHPKIQDS